MPGPDQGASFCRQTSDGLQWILWPRDRGCREKKPGQHSRTWEVYSVCHRCPFDRVESWSLKRRRSFSLSLAKGLPANWWYFEADSSPSSPYAPNWLHIHWAFRHDLPIVWNNFVYLLVSWLSLSLEYKPNEGRALSVFSMVSSAPCTELRPC